MHYTANICSYAQKVAVHCKEIDKRHLWLGDEQTLRRELWPLQKLPGFYPKVLLTLDDDPELSHEGIRQLNALDFLLR